VAPAAGRSPLPGAPRAEARARVRASDAEVDVVLDITAKVPHVFQSFTGLLNEAGEALDRAALFLRQHVRG
jgi:hypothetical protein